MPGYSVTAVEKPGATYICCYCELVLRDAVQTKGQGYRLCMSCFHEISSKPEGEVPDAALIKEVNEGYYDDKATQQDVLKLLVKCDNSTAGCEWQGKLQDLEQHLSQCTNTNTSSSIPNQIKQLQIRLDEVESLVRQASHSNSKVDTIVQKLQSEINTIRKEMQKQKNSYQHSIGDLCDIVANVSDSEEKCMEAIGSLTRTLSNFMDQVFATLATMEMKIGLEMHRQLMAVGVVDDGIQYWYTAGFTPTKLKRRPCIQSIEGSSETARASSVSAPRWWWYLREGKASDSHGVVRAAGANVVTVDESVAFRSNKKIPGGSPLYMVPVPWLQYRNATLAAAVLRWWYPPRPGLQPFFTFVTFIPKFFF